MAQTGAQVYSLDGQLGVRVVVSDGVAGMIFNGIATGQCALNAVKRLTKLKDAPALGLNAAYDTNNKVLVYESIKEFFRLQPEGILYIMIVASSATQVTMVQTHWPNLLKSNVVRVNERIGPVALKRHVMDEEYEAVLEGGYWDEVTDALTAFNVVLQGLEEVGTFPGILILDGSYCAAATTLTDLRATYGVTGCAVCIGQDPQIAGTNAAHAKYADTAALLGVIAQRKACENAGAPKVENPPAKYRSASTVSMTDTLANRWLTTRFSSGTATDALTPAEIVTLNTKGVCYFDRVYGVVGIYGVNGATTGEATSDFAWIERFNVIQKAKHMAYRFFAPYKNYIVNLQGAKMAPEDVAWLTNEANNAVMEQLLFERNISEYQGVEDAGIVLPQDYNFITGEHETDPEENVAPETLRVKIGIPPRGVMRGTIIYVGLKV